MFFVYSPSGTSLDGIYSSLSCTPMLSATKTTTKTKRNTLVEMTLANNWIFIHLLDDWNQPKQNSQLSFFVLSLLVPTSRVSRLKGRSSLSLSLSLFLFAFRLQTRLCVELSPIHLSDYQTKPTHGQIYPLSLTLHNIAPHQTNKTQKQRQKYKTEGPCVHRKHHYS